MSNQREIRFRAYVEGKGFISGFNMINFHYYYTKGIEPEIENIECHLQRYSTTWKLSEVILEQYSGRNDKNGVPIFEGDIFRVEEQEKKMCDQCDGCGWWEGGPSIQTQCEPCLGTGFIEEAEKHYYLVIVWVQEWCMFATLRVDDEYPAYLREGVKALDEPMFWTYTLEDTDSRKFFSLRKHS